MCKLHLKLHLNEYRYLIARLYKEMDGNKVMRVNKKSLESMFSLTLGLVATVCFNSPVALAKEPSVQAKTPGATTSAIKTASTSNAESARDGSEAKTIVYPSSAALTQAINNFKSHIDEATWQPVVQAIKTALSEPSFVKASPQAILLGNPLLKELGVRIIDGQNIRAVVFPDVIPAKEVLVQWRDIKAPAHKGGASVATTNGITIVNIPSGIVVRDVHYYLPAAAPHGKATTQAEPVARPVKMLVVAGNQRQSGNVFVQAYKVVASSASQGTPSTISLAEHPEALSNVPGFLIQNVTGKAAFSGNDLVLTIWGSQPTPYKLADKADQADKALKLPGSESTAYKVVLKYAGGKYQLEGRAVEDSPYNVVCQFLQALQEGKVELAKCWLADPRLVSIPKYLGLTTHKGTSSVKVVNMAPQTGGGYRFRLITFERNDLIVQVVKIKNNWIIKSIFVAPADPLLQKIAETLPDPCPAKLIAPLPVNHPVANKSIQGGDISNNPADEALEGKKSRAISSGSGNL